MACACCCVRVCALLAIPDSVMETAILKDAKTLLAIEELHGAKAQTGTSRTASTHSRTSGR